MDYSRGTDLNKSVQTGEHSDYDSFFYVYSNSPKPEAKKKVDRKVKSQANTPWKGSHQRLDTPEQNVSFDDNQFSLIEALKETQDQIADLDLKSKECNEVEQYHNESLKNEIDQLTIIKDNYLKINKQLNEEVQYLQQEDIKISEQIKKFQDEVNDLKVKSEIVKCWIFQETQENKIIQQCIDKKQQEIDQCLEIIDELSNSITEVKMGIAQNKKKLEYIRDQIIKQSLNNKTLSIQLEDRLWNAKLNIIRAKARKISLKNSRYPQQYLTLFKEKVLKAKIKLLTAKQQLKQQVNFQLPQIQIEVPTKPEPIPQAIDIKVNPPSFPLFPLISGLLLGYTLGFISKILNNI